VAYHRRWTGRGSDVLGAASGYGVCMGFLDKVGSFLKREAADLGDAADGVKDKFEQELSKREQELKMSPSEKIAALQAQASGTDSKLDAIADKALGREALADAATEVSEIPATTGLPNVTHVVSANDQADGQLLSTDDTSANDTAASADHARSADELAALPETPDSTEGTATDAPEPVSETLSPSNARGDSVAPTTPGTKYDKTPAQIKYEQARDAADDLLAELRGELKDDGSI